MTSKNKQHAGWKQKIVHEVTQYWIIFIYLAVFFGVFNNYRRLVLEEYEISYLHYGIGLIEAAVLAKVILIGDAMHLGRKHEDRPLIVPTLYKTIFFSLLAAGFKALEELLRGLLHGRGLAGGLQDLLSKGWYGILANALVIFAAFVPFFAFRELLRVMGSEKIRTLFFGSKRVSDGKEN